MQLFSPESTVFPLLKTFSSINAAQKRNKPLFSLFSFGDSLRTTTNKKIFLNEANSNFPTVLKERRLDKAKSWIVLSDGHFTNSFNLKNYSENRSIYYLKLPTPTPIPSIKLSVQAPQYTLTDSTVPVECLASGFIPIATKLTISCFDQNKLLSQHIELVDSGNINITIPINIKINTTGKHVLRISAVLNDTIRSEYRHLLHVAPKSLTYTLHAATPSIDNRFISLALKNNLSFSKPGKVTDSTDLLIVTRWPTDIEQAVSLLKKQGLILFAGCLPCSTSQSYTTNSLIINMSRYSPVNTIDATSFPPTTVFNDCMQTPPTSTFAWVTIKNNTLVDTIPALFVSTFARKTALILSIRDFWKWDFLPLMSTQGEELTFSFSSRILETAKELLLSNSSDNYVAFSENYAVESDSIAITHFLPGSIQYNRPITVHLKLNNTSGTVIDTSFTSITRGTHTESFMIPPVQSGIYHFTSSITSNSYHFTYNDSVFISHDNREFSVKNQNEFLLNEIGRPLTTTDSAALYHIFSTDDLSLRIPVKETLHIQRNWVLLLLIFTLYITELIIRRKYHFD